MKIFKKRLFFDVILLITIFLYIEKPITSSKIHKATNKNNLIKNTLTSYKISSTFLIKEYSNLLTKLKKAFKSSSKLTPSQTIPLLKSRCQKPENYLYMWSSSIIKELYHQWTDNNFNFHYIKIKRPKRERINSFFEDFVSDIINCISIKGTENIVRKVFSGKAKIKFLKSEMLYKYFEELSFIILTETKRLLKSKRDIKSKVNRKVNTIGNRKRTNKSSKSNGNKPRNHHNNHKLFVSLEELLDGKLNKKQSNLNFNSNASSTNNISLSSLNNKLNSLDILIKKLELKSKNISANNSISFIQKEVELLTDIKSKLKKSTKSTKQTKNNKTKTQPMLEGIPTDLIPKFLQKFKSKHNKLNSFSKYLVELFTNLSKLKLKTKSNFKIFSKWFKRKNPFHNDNYLLPHVRYNKLFDNDSNSNNNNRN